ncbi:sigma factor-like helix-turn-helix DNA-binding protein [Romboutsia lituseburensis]|uniref:sigma factor-like helix-turn-helix DNA-binding protein n=1 Tax=Romboutsia lituseburensis TaxID=1537 RepID=UPI0022EA5979|nr:sigma factor-like helix-turn-helix DNA-binding protein [Romboutsia lituseburensis]
MNNENSKKVEKDLINLRKNLISMSAWKTEIEVLKEKLSAYKDRDFNLMSSSNITITLDDILERDETRLNALESNIDYTNYKLKEYKACLEVLDDREYEVINRKYLRIENKRCSYHQIAKDMYSSHTTIRRIHNSAIQKITEYKYKTLAIA